MPVQFWHRCCLVKLLASSTACYQDWILTYNALFCFQQWEWVLCQLHTWSADKQTDLCQSWIPTEIPPQGVVNQQRLVQRSVDWLVRLQQGVLCRYQKGILHLTPLEDPRACASGEKNGLRFVPGISALVPATRGSATHWCNDLLLNADIPCSSLGGSLIKGLQLVLCIATHRRVRRSHLLAPSCLAKKKRMTLIDSHIVRKCCETWGPRWSLQTAPSQDQAHIWKLSTALMTLPQKGWIRCRNRWICCKWCPNQTAPRVTWQHHPRTSCANRQSIRVVYPQPIHAPWV